jgi:hypothetical protein
MRTAKTEHLVRYDDGEPRASYRRRLREEWLAFIPQAHEGYVSWDEFKRIRHTMTANVRGWQHTGAPTRGSGLLTGLLRCRRCGRRLVVCYTGNAHNVLRYILSRRREPPQDDAASNSTCTVAVTSWSPLETRREHGADRYRLWKVSRASAAAHCRRRRSSISRTRARYLRRIRAATFGSGT